MESVGGVRVHRDESVAVAGVICQIMLDRPEAMNALNTAMAARLAQVCAEIAADRQVRAVVLAAAGERAFCVGADLKERAAMSDAELMAQRPVFRAAFGSVLALPQPVIAAVHGFALGGGCELALSCDLIVADDTAIFGLPNTQDSHWATADLSVPAGRSLRRGPRSGSGREACSVVTLTLRRRRQGPGPDQRIRAVRPPAPGRGWSVAAADGCVRCRWPARGCLARRAGREQ